VTAPDVLAASVRISAPPEVVFPYFTDPALIVQWLGDWAQLDPTPGGEFALDMGTDTRTAVKVPVRGEYVVVEPPHRVVFTWGVAGRDELPAGSTTVEVRLTADASETLVELYHHGLPPAQLDGHRSGWAEKLGTLASVWA
jgi:uncharacterized protein YndB with AHSA1/START domain